MAMKAFAPFLIVGSLSVIQSITIDQPWQNLLQNSMFQVHTIAPLSFFNSTMNSTNNHFAETINSYVTGQWLTDLKVDLSKHSDKKQKYPNGWSREEMEAGITWDQTHQNAIENAAYSTFAGFTSSSCASLPSSYSPFMFCSGVVDYPFFLMFNESMSHLETEARAQAAGLLAFLNTSCLSDAKKMICARVYRPCKAGSASASGSHLPYTRPCKSLCTAASYMGSSCRGRLEAFQAAHVNCTEIDPLTGISIFDPTDDQNVCNALPSSAGQLVVAHPSEPYVGTWCKGIAEEIYLPSPASVSANLAPLLPPFVLQTVVEKGFGAFESLIPRYFSDACLTSQRKVMCALTFMGTTPSHALDAVFGGPVYLPSFPSKQLCVDYDQSCGSSLLAALPVLRLNCSTSLPGGIQLFPAAEQTLMVLDFGYGPIDLKSQPNTYLSSSFQLTTQCPYAFGPIDIPAKGLSIPIAGTACAVSCPMMIYTSAEQVQQDTVNEAIYGSGFFCSIFMLINLYTTSSKKRNIFIVMTTVLSGTFYGYEFLQIVAMGPKYNDLLCASATSWHAFSTDVISYDISPRNQQLSNNCAVSGGIMMFSNVGTRWLLGAVFVELWLRVVWGVKNIKLYRRFYMWGGLVVTAVLGVLLIVRGSMLVPGASTCNYTSTSTVDTWALGGAWGYFMYLVAIVLGLHVVVQCVRVSMKVSSGDTAYANLMKLWNTYRILFMFELVALFSVLPMVLMLAWLSAPAVTDAATTGLLDWIVCLFSHFNNAENIEYLSVCGNIPNGRLQPSEVFAFRFFQLLGIVLMLLMTLNSDAVAFWKSVVDVVLKRRSSIVLGKKEASSYQSHQSSNQSQSDVDKDDRRASIAQTPEANSPETSLSLKPSLLVVATGSHKSSSVVPLMVAAADADVEMAIPLQFSSLESLEGDQEDEGRDKGTGTGRGTVKSSLNWREGVYLDDGDGQCEA